jgi:3',5'-cyclic-AMP phosphodiesterase
MSTKVHESSRRTRAVNALRTHVPPLPPGSGSARPPRRLEVFGVGTTWVQLTWSALGPGPVRFRCADAVVGVEADGGPGAVVLSGLAAGAGHRIELSGPGLPGPIDPIAARTLVAPPGELLHRIATVNDSHLGSHGTGFLHTIVEKPERPPDDAHPVRCLRAALREAAAWGADELIVKGDLVEQSERTAWAQADAVLGELDIPVSILPGNHERSGRGDCDPADGLAAHGRHLVTGVEHVDRPGLRVALLDTVIAGGDRGHLADLLDDVLDAACGTKAPLLVAMHHQPMHWRIPTYLPAGVPAPEARRFLTALGAGNPRTLVTSGHTHRHRRRHLGPVTVTEVGSTKDFPGTWAGYEVHEGGIVQTVRRIAEPSCIRWTDHTRRAALGVWQLWAPGRLTDRCFTRTW